MNSNKKIELQNGNIAKPVLGDVPFTDYLLTN